MDAYTAAKAIVPKHVAGARSHASIVRCCGTEIGKPCSRSSDDARRAAVATAVLSDGKQESKVEVAKQDAGTAAATAAPTAPSAAPSGDSRHAAAAGALAAVSCGAVLARSCAL